MSWWNSAANFLTTPVVKGSHIIELWKEISVFYFSVFLKWSIFGGICQILILVHLQHLPTQIERLYDLETQKAVSVTAGSSAVLCGGEATVAPLSDHRSFLWRQLWNTTAPAAAHPPPIYHFTNKDRSMVMLILLSLILFLCPARHLPNPQLSRLYPPPPPPALSPPPSSSPPLLHCTQTQQDASCNHCWTQFQGQFEDYLLSLVNKKKKKGGQAFCGCSFATDWQVNKWSPEIVITVNTFFFKFTLPVFNAYINYNMHYQYN